MMPQNNIASLKCPVLLIACDDDTVVKPEEVQGFAAAVQRQGKSVRLVRRAQGGHVDGMEGFGMPTAIHWLNGIKSDIKSPSTK